jgi:dipeptidase D
MAEPQLESLEPEGLWRFFRELSGIPRGSRHEAEAAAWVARRGMAMGHEVIQDSVGNVIIRKKAARGRDDRPMTALQAHVDMVCEKAEGSAHDFLRDPIPLYLDGDRVRARGTTLGADDGIGVAAALAVLESRDIRHGPLEVLVTVDEEGGFTGAASLQPGALKSRYLLNLDTETEGDLVIGCAGGLDTLAVRRVRRMAPTAPKVPFRLKVAGLKGGHAGMEVHLGRGNALHILARLLWSLFDPFELELASFTGGGKRNVIPREAFAVFFMDPARHAGIRERLAQLEGDCRAMLGAFDPGVVFEVEPVTGVFGQVIRSQDARQVISFLFTLVQGVQAMSPDIDGLVQTSTNLAVAATRGDLVEVHLSHRSPVDACKEEAADQVAALCELAGFESRRGEDFPGWRPKPRNGLVALVDGIHRATFGRPMSIKSIHAGLECGLIGEGHPDLEMVSFGPDLWDAHTPAESVSVPSVARFWTLLSAVLEGLT